MTAHDRCEFCGRSATEGAALPPQGRACRTCIQRLGGLLREEPRIGSVWAALLFEEEDDEPEPMVRLADGRRVELRERTEEMKRELTPAQRAELADTYVKLGMFREGLQEIAHVLVEGDDQVREAGLQILFTPPLSAPDALDRVKPFLLPV